MTNPKKVSILYRHIEKMQGDTPWGRLLDAGTGINSIKWVSSLDTRSWTAVTGSASERYLTEKALPSGMRADDRLIIGNWGDQAFLEGETFDTVIADYLLGSTEAFAPYLQSYLFSRLRPHVTKRLYVTGLEPYVPTPIPEDPAAQLVWEIGRYRDACVLLKGGIPYREYPGYWSVAHIGAAGFKIIDTRTFSKVYKSLFVNAQIDIATVGLEALDDQRLAQSLRDQGKVLREKALDWIEKEGSIKTGQHYVITAEPA